MEVACDNPEVILTHTYGEFLAQLAFSEPPETTPFRHSLMFLGADTEQNTVYFFVPRCVRLLPIVLFIA